MPGMTTDQDSLASRSVSEHSFSIRTLTDIVLLDQEDPADQGFESRWSWRQDSKDVHSYSCAKLNSDSLPMPLSAAESLSVDIDWLMSMSGSSNGKTSSSVIANVAFDMFADADISKAANSTAAAFEIMIWLGSRGAPYPIGYNLGQSNATYHLGDQTLFVP